MKCHVQFYSCDVGQAVLFGQGDGPFLTVHRIVVGYRDEIDTSLPGFLKNIFNIEIAIRTGLGMDMQV
jgi:hypothetical protein